MAEAGTAASNPARRNFSVSDKRRGMGHLPFCTSIRAGFSPPSWRAPSGHTRATAAAGPEAYGSRARRPDCTQAELPLARQARRPAGYRQLEPAELEGRGDDAGNEGVARRAALDRHRRLPLAGGDDQLRLLAPGHPPAEAH